MKNLKKIRNQLFKLLYQGKKYYCLYCTKTYRKFMHEGVKAKIFKKYKVAGGGYKKNVKCPNCGSTDRIRLLYLFFELRTEIFKKPLKVLHVSPNALLARKLFGAKNINYTCGALNPEEFKEFNAIKLDVTCIDIPDNHFDVVICNHVLEHVPKDSAAMNEIYRVLKPGGYAILQVPFAIDLQQTIEDSANTTRKQRKIAYGQTDHLRLYGVDYITKLTNAGFRVERDNPFKNNWPTDLEKHRLDKNEDVIVCYK
jgi:SAM-dependent methyltransferase